MVKENLALKSLAWNGPGTRSYQKTARNVTMFVELILALALITNFEAISFESASRQIFDTSCGFSSVTALMSLYEDDALQDEIRKEAVSAWNEYCGGPFRRVAQ